MAFWALDTELFGSIRAPCNLAKQRCPVVVFTTSHVRWTSTQQKSPPHPSEVIAVINCSCSDGDFTGTCIKYWLERRFSCSWGLKAAEPLDPELRLGWEQPECGCWGVCVWCPQEHPDALRRALHGLLDVHRLQQPAGAAPLPQAAGSLRLLRAGQAGLGQARPGRPLQGNSLPLGAHRQVLLSSLLSRAGLQHLLAWWCFVNSALEFVG